MGALCYAMWYCLIDMMGITKGNKPNNKICPLKISNYGQIAFLKPLYVSNYAIVSTLKWYGLRISCLLLKV